MELNRNQVWNNGGRLAALYDPLAAGRSLDDSRQILSPPEAVKLDELSHAILAWENREQRHRERTGNQLPKTCDLLFFSPCVPQILRES